MSQPSQSLAAKTIGEIWDGQHADGSFHTDHPFDEVIAFIRRYSPRDRRGFGGRKARVLDLGCGSGNHLAFLAQEGFDVVGIDASAVALEKARKRGEQLGQRYELVRETMDEMSFDEGSFDMVVDRKGICVLPPDQGEEVVAKVQRMLAPGGAFLATPMSEEDSRFMERQDDNGYVGYRPTDREKDPSVVAMRGYGFWSLGRLRRAFQSGWDVLEMRRVVIEELRKGRESRYVDWRVVARKAAPEG